MRRIFLDMDGATTDWAGGMLRLMGLDSALAACIDVFDGGTAIVAAARGITFDEADDLIWRTIDATDGDFWRDLDWLPDGQQLLRDCCAMAPTIFLTSPSGHPSSASGKLRWMARHHEVIREALALCPGSDGRRKASRIYALSPAKEEFAHPGAVLVDDKESNVARFIEAGGRAVLWPAPWNANRGMIYAEALAEIERQVRG